MRIILFYWSYHTIKNVIQYQLSMYLWIFIKNQNLHVPIIPPKNVFSHVNFPLD